MEINKNLDLILTNVHLYDIEACHYTILNNLGYDLTHVDREDKTERNIQIGKMMRENPRLTSLLRNTTESVINDYISKNNIKEDDIVIRQYDGMILIRKLECSNIGHIPLDLRKTFEVFISSIDRKKYIAVDGNKELTVKGVPFKYPKMNDFYKRLCNIVLLGKKSAYFRQLQYLKDDLMKSNDPYLFAIPTKSGKINVILKGYGELEISKTTLKIMDTNDIDKERYFKFYLQPFTKSVVFQFVRLK